MKPLTNRSHQIVAHVVIDGPGIHTITDQSHHILGYYDPRTNRTTDRSHRVVGYGCLLAKLIPGDLAEDGAGIVAPEKPMTPAQGQREAKRKAGVAARMQDQRVAYAKRMSDLRAKMSS